MKKETKKTEGKEGVQMISPVCALLDMSTKLLGKESEFSRHITNAKVEFLLAAKSLIDRRIESLEKSQDKGKANKYSKIDVGE